MDIRDSIRKAFSRVDEDDDFDKESQSTIAEIRNFLKKAGYDLYDVEYNEDGPELFIRSGKPKHLHPEIYYDRVEKVFEVDVVKHGLLGADDLEEIIKGYENALSVVKYLDSVGLSKLRLNSVDEEEE